MEDVSSTHWLMQYRVLTLVHQCRRLIRDEFGVRLALTDADLRERLTHYADESGTDELRDLMARIALELGDAEPTAPAGQRQLADSRRMYRGRPLGEAPPNDDANREIDDEDGDDRPKTVIYRGRLVR